jgi:hypothetical protein
MESRYGTVAGINVHKKTVVLQACNSARIMLAHLWHDAVWTQTAGGVPAGTRGSSCSYGIDCPVLASCWWMTLEGEFTLTLAQVQRRLWSPAITCSWNWLTCAATHS